MVSMNANPHSLTDASRFGLCVQHSYGSKDKPAQDIYGSKGVIEIIADETLLENASTWCLRRQG